MSGCQGGPKAAGWCLRARPVRHLAAAGGPSWQGQLSSYLNYSNIVNIIFYHFAAWRGGKTALRKYNTCLHKQYSQGLLIWPVCLWRSYKRDRLNREFCCVECTRYERFQSVEGIQQRQQGFLPFCGWPTIYLDPQQIRNKRYYLIWPHCSSKSWTTKWLFKLGRRLEILR